MIFVHFIIDNDGIEYHDYSWFNNYSIAHYEDSKSITDKDMIEQTYAEGRSDEDFENNFDKKNNTYTDFDGDVIAVHRVQEMTEKELDVLVKLGVLSK